MNTSLQHVV